MPRVHPSRRRPLVAAAFGVTAVVVVIASFDVFDPHVSRAVPLMLLLVPVTVTSVIGGPRVSVPLSIAVGIAYCFAFLPPIGSIRIGLTEDMLTLASFVAVAVVVSVVTDIAHDDEALRDRDRAVLLRSVSHDLRNPLGTIRAASAELRNGVVEDPQARTQLLDLMVDESDRLDRIVGNLLSMSRIEAGALTPCICAEPIDDVVLESVRRLERISGGRIDVQLATGVADVAIDRTQIDQVITNLIENALRHGVVDGAPSPITVCTAQHGSMVEVSVTDRGPGIPTDRRSRPFEFFEPSGATGVHGVGLAVCKAIVDAHGGIIALGDAAGGGARVSFSVPAA